MSEHRYNSLMRSLHTCVIITAALLLSAYSDACGRESDPPGKSEDFDELTATHSNCFRFDCPVLEVTVLSDGRVRHSVSAVNHTGGLHESRIDRHGLAQIAKALHDSGINEMRQSYRNEADGCVHAFMDMPTTSLNVSRGEKYKNVLLDAGCIGPTVPTKRINALVEVINEVTGTWALVERLKRVRPRDANDKAPSK